MILSQAYHYLYMGALVILSVLTLLCLLRAILGPRIADRVVAINMICTLTLCMICILGVMLGEGYLADVALMGLRLWELEPVLVFITVAMLVQITLTVAYVLLVVFRAMGRDYEATVVCAGFGGIALGSTATAVANMTAVTREFGAARQAFIVVPLVCGFSIDLVNAIVIGWLAR